LGGNVTAPKKPTLKLTDDRQKQIREALSHADLARAPGGIETSPLSCEQRRWLLREESVSSQDTVVMILP
jgi:hypothetical protein